VKRREFFRMFVWIISVAFLFCIDGDRGAYAESDNLIVSVMTRNMDAGTDLQYVVGAQTVDEFVAGVINTIAEVEASNIPERAAQLAAEIAAVNPELIALQEVTTWKIDDVTYDQLELLMAALENAGMHYRIAALQTLADLPVEIPDLLSVRFTDYNAILVRTDLPPGHLMIIGTETHLYENYLQFDVPDGPTIPVLNGWMAVDVKIRGARFKFANTHLLTAVPGDLFEATEQIQLAQAAELMAGLSASSLPIILAGDFNSDAEVPQNFPDQTETAALIASSGYLDVWHFKFPEERGYTWPLFLEDQPPPDFTVPSTPFERIDLIFSKGPVPLLVELTGTEKGSEGVYASDHVGVVARFSLENHRPDVPRGKSSGKSNGNQRQSKRKTP